jgi:hypothetical protein
VYAKVFNQIFDSSIADDFRLRHFFMDMLVLADLNGCVDMTQTAIAARTRIPLKDVTAMLVKLEQPDRESRTPDADGRRIERLDDHRTWGWSIINYTRFREIASEEQRREKTRARVANFRAKRQQNATCNAPVTLANASNAMQRQRQRQKEREAAPTLRSVSGRIASEKQLQILKGRLKNLEVDTSEQWQRDSQPELVAAKQKLRTEVEALENSLLK